MTKALYAFSGDPITYGHIDIVERAAKVFDEVIVGIGKNPDKNYTFSLEERTEMAQRSLSHIPNARVVAFEGLLVDYAYEQQVHMIVKGLRDGKDFDYETQLHQIGESQQLGIDTLFLPCRRELSHISSSTVKALQKEHGLIHEYVPLYVKQSLEAAMSEQFIIGITGEPGTGKSYIGELLVTQGKERNIPVHHIELDHLGHKILGVRNEPSYQAVRQQIAETFGKQVVLSNGYIDRKVLGEIVFNNEEQLGKLNEIMYDPLLVGVRQELRGKKGLILFDAALLTEAQMTHICNNNVLLITTDEATQQQRLRHRGLTPEQMQRRLASQYRTAEKKAALEKRITEDHHGKLWMLDNSEKVDSADAGINDLLTQVFLAQLTQYFGMER